MKKQAKFSLGRVQGNKLRHNGEELTLREWAERFGVKYISLYHRLARGRTLAEALALGRASHPGRRAANEQTK